MLIEQDPELLRKMRREIQKNQELALLLGISEDSLLEIICKNPSPEIEARKAKARQLFRDYNPLLEPKIAEYLIKSATESDATPKRHDECYVCEKEYVGAFPLCGVCGYVYREEFMKKN